MLIDVGHKTATDECQIMSYLGAFLQSYMAAERLTQRAMASKLGLGISHVSRILAGKRKELSQGTVAKMTSGISGDAQVQGELVRAYLLDQCPPVAGKLVRIETATVNGAKLVREEHRSAGTGPTDEVSELARYLRADQINLRLVRTLKELAIAASHCPELQDLLDDLTKLEIGPKKKRKSEKSENLKN